MAEINRIILVEETPRLVSVSSYSFETSSKTNWHSHKRAELIVARHGLLTMTTDNGKWFAPSGHGLLVAPNILHELALHGGGEIWATFFADESLRPADNAECDILPVSPLLREALASLAGEPALYDIDGRGGHLAALIDDEVRRAERVDSGLPLPSHPRLKKFCRELSADPGRDLDLDDWAELTGFSRSTLTRRFKLETGMTIAEWRRRLRVIHALALEAQGVIAARAAEASGYRSHRAFKSMVARGR